MTILFIAFVVLVIVLTITITERNILARRKPLNVKNNLISVSQAFTVGHRKFKG